MLHALWHDFSRATKFCAKIGLQPLRFAIAGAKARISPAYAARLKSCPDTKHAVPFSHKQIWDLQSPRSQ
jgi:hypothetical protein